MALSGALVRELLGRGEQLPLEFTRPEVAEILREWARGPERPSAPTPAVKETKAQRTERLKREMNPWEQFPTILRFAREGFQSIPAEWLDTYFRWWGAYTQGDGIGESGERAAKGRPCLTSWSGSASRMASSSPTSSVRSPIDEKGARGIADITVRENIQLHWVRIEDLPGLYETSGAGGDDDGDVRGCDPQHHGLPRGRRGSRRAGRCLSPRRVGHPDAQRQPRVL